MLLEFILSEKKFTVPLSHKPEDLPQQALDTRRKSRDWFNRLFHDPDRDNPEYRMEDKHTFAKRVMTDLDKKGQRNSLYKHIDKLLQKQHRKDVKKRFKDMNAAPNDAEPATRLSKRFGTGDRNIYLEHPGRKRWYEMKQVDADRFEARWGGKGFEKGSIVYPISHWDKILGSKMKKGYDPVI